MNISLILLAFGLAADAFAVSLSQGAVAGAKTLRTALIVALAFGAAQAIAPLIGWGLGLAFQGLIEAWDHWIAFALLAAIGAKMVWEGNKPKGAEDAPEKPAGAWQLFMLAIATSIDAAAAGITLQTIGAPVVLAVSVIGLVTFACCFAGVLVGRAGSKALGSNATIIGGLLLIVIGAKVLIDHKAFG